MTSPPANPDTAQPRRHRSTRLVGSETNIALPARHGRIDEYVALLAAEYGRSIAGEIGSHLHAFFREVDKEPDDVTTADVFGFVGRQMGELPGDVRRGQLMEPRLRSIVGFFAYLDTSTCNPRADT